MKPATSAKVPFVYRTAYVPGKRDPAALLHLLLRHGRWSDYLFYEGEGRMRLALGAWASVVLHGDALHFFDGKETTREAVVDPLKQTERLLARVPVQDWTAYGYVGFDLAGYYSPYAKRIAEPPLFFLIPETEVLLEDQGATIRSIGDGEDARHLLEMGGLSPVPPYEPAQVALEEVDRDGYTGRVRALIQQIKEGRLQKAIIARSVLVPGNLHILGTYTVGAAVNSRARSFCFSLGQVGGVGFPPETLLEADGHGLVQTNPLAGTRPRGMAPAEDELLASELFHVAKEVKEHALSVLDAQTEVGSVCEPGSVRIEDFMQIKRFRFVQHLSSRVYGRLVEGLTTWDALRALFPGITVSGIDKPSALTWIDRLEEEARGPYAGAVGWIDSHGAADLAIALRSAFQYAGAIHLSAGAGIVAESDPDQEYQESHNKMSAMLHSLVVHAEGRE